MPLSTADHLAAIRKFHLLEAAEVDDIARKIQGKNVELRVVLRRATLDVEHHSLLKG